MLLTTPTTKQLNDARSIALSSRAGGFTTERLVREHLLNMGHPTVDSTQQENIHLDIDCRHAITRHGISIKRQNQAIHTGRLCFETRRFNMRSAFKYNNTPYSTDAPLYAQLDTESPARWWEPSWYLMGKADWYVIAVAEDIYKIKVPKLHEYVSTAGWSMYHKQLSKQVKHQHYGRTYTDYQVGLLHITELLHNNVMTQIK
jgi:hypothetical protein